MKCYKDRESIREYSSSVGACCAFRREPPSDVYKKSNINIQISSGNKVPTNCVEVNGSGSLSQGYCYKVCLTPESAKSDFMFLKPCSPTTPRNNAKDTESLVPPWCAQTRSAATNNEPVAPIELKTPNVDRPLPKNQMSTLKRYGSVNTECTVLHKAMPRELEHGIAPTAGQYWTWGTHMRDYKMSPPFGGIPNCPWTPRCGLSLPMSPPLDYQHNVYIPGTPTTHCMLKPTQCRDLGVTNTFSTFGKKRKLIPSYDCKDDVVINNDLFNK
ncbi:protocadherin beta-15-like [Arapaima gigas]